MQPPDFVILYVADVARSAALYARILNRSAIEASPSFAMLPLREAMMLGLWQMDVVSPSVTSPPGGFELALTVPDRPTLMHRFDAWSALPGLTILEAPQARAFGLAFLAIDPDGNRLRVFAPATEGVA